MSTSIATLHHDEPLGTPMRVEQRGDKWVVLPETGDEVLGEHDTKEEADAQLAAIEASQKRSEKAAAALGAKVPQGGQVATLPSGRAISDADLRRMFGGVQRFDAGAAAVRTNVWDRGLTFGAGPNGRKEKDGEEVQFTVETFKAFVDNWYSRGGKLPLCLDHQSALGGIVRAPAAGWYDAFSVVHGGAVVYFKALAASAATEPNVAELQLEAKKFATADDPEPSPDGLWGFRCEVTPLGESATEGLRNYKGISPLFVMQGTNEQGEPIGPVMYDWAAVNVQFQAGCELTLSMLPAASKETTVAKPVKMDSGVDPGTNGHKTVRCPACGQDVFTQVDNAQWPPLALVEHTLAGSQTAEKCTGSGKPVWTWFSGAPSGDAANGNHANKDGKNMNETAMKKFGVAEGAKPEDIHGKLSAFAADCQTKMDAAVEKKDGEAMKALAGELDAAAKMGDGGDAAYAHHFAHFGHMAKMAKSMGDLFLEHKGDDKDDEAAAMSALAQKFGLDPKLPRPVLLTALRNVAQPAVDADKLTAKIKAELKAEAEAEAAKKMGVELTERAVSFGMTFASDKEKAEFVAFATASPALAEKTIAQLPGARALSRQTVNGKPIGKPDVNANLAGDDPKQVRQAYARERGVIMKRDKCDLEQANEKLRTEKPELWAQFQAVRGVA